MLTLVKLGGSLITDKRVEKSFRRDIMQRLADEIAVVLEKSPENQLIIGHGSGSFGHFVAKRANTINGVHSLDDWKAFAHVSGVAAELNYLVCECFQSSGVPVWRFQPSASMVSRNGEVVSMSLIGIKLALSKGIVPVVYGDVSLDSILGGTIISTEKIFFYISSMLQVDRIFLVGEVPGVYSTSGEVISSITMLNYNDFSLFLGGSGGVDVTGGMETKVVDMLKIVTRFPAMTIRILDGLQQNLLQDTLMGKTHPGTLISNE